MGAHQQHIWGQKVFFRSHRAYPCHPVFFSVGNAVRNADQKIAVGSVDFDVLFLFFWGVLKADANRNKGTSEFQTAYAQELFSDEHVLMNDEIME
eukprot:7047583-Karenia_brevis.AAC.2